MYLKHKIISTEVSGKIIVVHILRWPFAHDSSVAVAPSSSLMLGAHNSGHTATLRSAQMLGFASHFVCP